MATWDLDSPVQDPRLLRVQSYLTQTLQSTKAGTNAARMLSLYEFLKTRPFSSAAELRSSVTKQGEPLFTPEEAHQVFEQLKQKGGGAPPPEFFDRVFRKLASFNPFGSLASMVPFSLPSLNGLPLPSYATLQPWLYILYAYERDPVYGPPLSIALDATTKLLPTLAATIQNMAGPLIGLIPIPGGGPVGALIGWAIGSIFVFIAILMNLSRRKFGTAFVTSMNLIPVAGPALMEAAEDVQTTAVRVSQRRDKLVNSTRQLLGEDIASQVENTIPDLSAEEPDIPIDPPFAIPQLPKLTDIVNPGALVAPQTEVEQLADQATGESPPEPVAQPPEPVAQPPEPVSAPPPPPEQPLTTGKGRSRQWRKTLRSRRR